MIFMLAAPAAARPDMRELPGVLANFVGGFVTLLVGGAAVGIVLFSPFYVLDQLSEKVVDQVEGFAVSKAIDPSNA